MGCLWSCFRNIVVAICSLLKVALSVAIIIIVAVHLQDVNVSREGASGSVNVNCLMTSDPSDQNVCNYAYAVCGISLLTSLALSILMCLTCDACGLGPWFEFIIGGVLTAWWVIAGIVFTTKADDANKVQPPIPNENWRNSVAVMAWVTALLAGIMTLTYLIECLKCLRNCCSCCCDDDDEDRFAKV